jgi:hypothetical protein
VNIGKPFDADGKEIKPEDVMYSSTVIRCEGSLQALLSRLASLTGVRSHPPAFQCQVEPRSAVAYEMLERSLRQLAGIGDKDI